MDILVHNVCYVAKMGKGLTNEQIVQKAASLAEKRIGGKGRIAGTRKHTYAEKLIKKYQKVYGDRGLKLESTWKDHILQNTRRVKGATRIDVWDSVNNIAYDFKFTINPGNGLKQSQIDKILKHGPAGLKAVKEINP